MRGAQCYPHSGVGNSDVSPIAPTVASALFDLADTRSRQVPMSLLEVYPIGNNIMRLKACIQGWLVFLVFTLTSSYVLAEENKPYDRSHWFDDKAETSDDMRRVPQSNGFGDHDDQIVLVGGRVFDGTGRQAYPATVITKGKKISAILSPFESSYPAGAKIIDVTGKTVMPGLIDMHVHTTYLKHAGQPPLLSSKSQADAALRGVERLRHYLESGITTVRDVGSHGMAPFILKKYIHEGIIPGPRIFAAGQVIVGRGGHGTEGFGLLTAPTYDDALILEASGEDEWRDAVRSQFKNGADLIKLASHYAPEEIKAAVDEAHRLGLRVTVDAETQFIDMAVEAGVDCVEHPLPRSEKTIKLMKKHGIASIPTLVPYQLINTKGGYTGSTSRRFTLNDDSIMRMMKKMKRAGVKMGIGTDLILSQYKMLPKPYVQELNNFKAAGYSNTDALVVATKTNAEILGMDDRLGSIEVGKLADIIVIDGKPDENIDEIYNVEMVIVNGKFRIKDGHTLISRN